MLLLKYQAIALLVPKVLKRLCKGCNAQPRGAKCAKCKVIKVDLCWLGDKGGEELHNSGACWAATPVGVHDAPQHAPQEGVAMLWSVCKDVAAHGVLDARH